MSLPDGGNAPKPIVGYKMFGVPCGSCALPLSVLWLFKDHLEAWHMGTSKRCRLTYQPSQVIRAELSIPPKKPDARKLPRRYRTCNQCGVKFMNAITGIPADAEPTLCRSCRHTEKPFTHEPIQKRPPGIPLKRT